MEKKKEKIIKVEKEKEKKKKKKLLKVYEVLKTRNRKRETVDVECRQVKFSHPLSISRFENLIDLK